MYKDAQECLGAGLLKGGVRESGCHRLCNYTSECGPPLQVFSAPNYCDQMGNKGAFIHLDKTLKPKFTTFTAVPHPSVRPMQYAGMFGSFFGS